jgi:hypothetical protein
MGERWKLPSFTLQQLDQEYLALNNQCFKSNDRLRVSHSYPSGYCSCTHGYRGWLNYCQKLKQLPSKQQLVVFLMKTCEYDEGKKVEKE